MNLAFKKLLATCTLLAVGCVWANAQLTIIADFNTADFTGLFPGSTPMADAANAATIETTIDQAISQVTSLISYSGTFQINFLSDPNISLAASSAPLIETHTPSTFPTFKPNRTNPPILPKPLPPCPPVLAAVSTITLARSRWAPRCSMPSEIPSTETASFQATTASRAPWRLI